MFFYVYIIKSLVKNELYVGYTQNLRKRLEEHNQGTVFSTKSACPWKVIHYEAYRSEKDAHRRERYLKTSQGQRMLKRILKEYFYVEKRKN